MGYVHGRWNWLLLTGYQMSYNNPRDELFNGPIHFADLDGFYLAAGMCISWHDLPVVDHTFRNLSMGLGGLVWLLSNIAVGGA